MEFLHKKSKIPKHSALILGFFDGVHAGHQNVIKNTPDNKKILVTFSSSPAEYFSKNFCYIYPRKINYDLIKDLGIDYIYEHNFAEIAKLSATEYLNFLLETFSPITITSGFNHTFGAKRLGTPDFLKKELKDSYILTPPTIINNEIVSSTRIKNLLQVGDIETANIFLTRSFSIESTVIEGQKIGRKLGFPTANMNYPSNIVKIPYGVYKVKVLGKKAVMNWGTKPTFNTNEVLEVHIPNFNENLYNKKLKIEIISKLRDEIKFDNLECLKKQIEKDIEECLK